MSSGTPSYDWMEEVPFGSGSFGVVFRASFRWVIKHGQCERGAGMEERAPARAGERL